MVRDPNISAPQGVIKVPTAAADIEDAIFGLGQSPQQLRRLPRARHLLCLIARATQIEFPNGSAVIPDIVCRPAVGQNHRLAHDIGPRQRPLLPTKMKAEAIMYPRQSSGFSIFRLSRLNSFGTLASNSGGSAWK